jgi:hypothetical protein
MNEEIASGALPPADASGRRPSGRRERSPAIRRALALLDPPDANVTPTSRSQRGATAPDATGEPPVFEAGEPVRWRRRTRNWRYGRLTDPPLERDGSLRVVEDSTGATRSLRPSELERQVRGPRGALKWAPCQPIDTPTKPVQRGTDGVTPPPARTAQTTQGLGR